MTEPKEGQDIRYDVQYILLFKIGFILFLIEIYLVICLCVIEDLLVVI